MPTKKKLLITPERYWLDVKTCPIGVWEDCYNEGYHSLRRSKNVPLRLLIYILTFGIKGKKIKYSADTDYEAWNMIFGDWITRIGFDQDYEVYLRTVMRLNEVLAEYIKSEKKYGELTLSNRFLLNEIKRLKAEKLLFEKTGSTGEKTTINQVLQQLSKAQGYHMRRDVITVLDYFDTLKIYKDGSKSKTD